MADSEEFRLRRLKHEEHLSRVFDEVMGLGQFADSSRGSVTSSKSGEPDEATRIDKSSGQENPQQAAEEEEEQEEEGEGEEEESNGSRQEEKMEEGTVEPPLPRTSPTSSEQHSLFTLRTNDGEGTGRSGGAAFDDALDGMEDDEDWHFALPVGTLDEVCVDEATGKKRQSGQERSSNQENSFAYQSTEDQEDEQERERSSESPDTSHSSQGHTPDNSQDGGEMNQAEETEDSQEGDVQRSEAAPVEESNPPLSAPINIKDEPIDEGYDAALLPQNSVKQIKEELEHQEEELRISSVYSVGGGNAFTVPPISQVPAAVQAPPPAAIFIPSRGTVLQAVAPLTIRPQVPVQNSLPVLAPAPPPRPPQPTNPGIVRCSGCLKVLLKGQTAFQRKGSTQLFCSTVCLTGHLPPANKNRTCSQCHREILQPRDMITIPTEDNSYLHFCGLFCLSVFRHNKKQPDKTPDKWTDKKQEKVPEKLPEKPVDKQSERSICSVCKISNRIEHEVNHQGRLHKLCSNACFVTWRKIRQLAMNCCEGCGLYCNSNSGACQKLTIERTELNFCGPTCVSTYKQSCRKMVECANCHKAAIVASTLIERDQKGKVQLYCSAACVEQSRPPQHVLSGCGRSAAQLLSVLAQFGPEQEREDWASLDYVHHFINKDMMHVPACYNHDIHVAGALQKLPGAAFPCCQCKVSAVPQYHLAMVDGTIRNFCSYECVLTYRQSGQNSKPDPVNGISTHRDHYAPRQASPANSVPPVPQDSSSAPHQGHHPNHTSVPALVPSYAALSSPSVPGQAQAKAPADVLQKSAEGGAGDPSKLTCHQCNKQFNIKPVLFCHQGRISMFCSRTCCDQYKIQRSVLATCEHCKQEKVLFDTISYNQQDLTFCSENCKLLFRYELTSRNNVHPWRPCTYCSGFSLKMLHSHYGGRMEEFCKPHCMSQYTVLYYGMGRCDGCRKQGYMTEKLQCLGSVRNFCNLSCLLQYCYIHFETSRHINGIGTDQQTVLAPVHPNHSSKMNPVIADVVSLANGSVTQPSVSAETALTGALPSSNDGKNLDHASTQTDATRVPVFRRRQMKNKSVLCRPYTTDQETFCQLPETPIESAVIHFSQPALSISAPAQLDSSPNPGQTSAEAPTAPATSPKPQGDKQHISGAPARLAGRHFLGKRETDSDCKVCCHRKRKIVVEEEHEEKKQKMEEPGRKSGEEEANGLEPNEEKDGEKENCETSEERGNQTSYYCKTCAGEPNLCPVPCFEVYHTRLIYRTAPQLETKALSRPSGSSAEGEEKVRVVVVPVPVPVFIPVPMNMYSQHTPVPVTMPVPVPVPMVVPPLVKDMQDAAVQSEPLSVSEEKAIQVPASTAAETDQIGSDIGNAKSEAVAPTVSVNRLPVDVSSEGNTETNSGKPNARLEESTVTSQPPTNSTEHQPPSSPMMDLETDFPPESFDQKPSAPQRGVKRPRDCFSSRKRSRRRTGLSDRSITPSPVASKVNHLYGVKAWKSWVQQQDKEQTQHIKEDILECNSVELSFALTRFIQEVRRPNGDAYSPDSIFYLCLGIQQYLFMQGRIENIFTDPLYNQFTVEITEMLRIWRPKLLPSGGVVSSRVAESYLWECKQLGAYSPIVLLNTLLFFCTKNFGYTTLEQHQRLSFTNFTRCSKPCSRTGKANYLLHKSSSTAPHRQETEHLRKRQTAEELEMHQNVTNALQCPVRLYEFYLSRCPESVKKRTDVFYLQPEQNVHTHSSHWFTSQPLERATLESMLTRILAVREVLTEASKRRSSATTGGESLQ